ncbi:MAG: hypothetical protein JXM69_18400, partial [Anaerolineae bacterium]|nr:hypothetical protein [Anaerolineae bacterium]
IIADHINPDYCLWQIVFVSIGFILRIANVAHLGEPQPFGQIMWAEAKARGWEQFYDTQIIGDGAPWIWNLAGEHFFDSRQTLDWGHAAEHLYQAAELLYPHNPDRGKRWLKQTETRLSQGQAEQIALDLYRRQLF